MTIDLFGDETYGDQYGCIPSPFNYTGSKFKLFSLLKEYFPKSRKCLRDLFAGGGSVALNAVFDEIYANDIVAPLIEFYRFLQVNSWGDVLAAIEVHTIPKDDQEAYLQLRTRFNVSKNYIDFFILVCSCTNNMMRFNQKGEFNQTWGKRTFNKSIEGKLRNYHTRLYKKNNIFFSNRNFIDCPVFKGDFVYLDPPYTDQGAGYNAYWSRNMDNILYDYIDELNSKQVTFMLSNVAEHKGKINPYLDRLKKYRIIHIPFDYNKVSRSGASNTKEIIVINY